MTGKDALHSDDFISMIADHMDKGFLENIIDMFKYDVTLYSILPSLIKDERIAVRLGTTALMESLAEQDSKNIQKAIPVLLPSLSDDDPNVRGDTANILGIIALQDISDDLNPLLADENPNVRIIVEEAIEDIRKRSGGT